MTKPNIVIVYHSAHGHTKKQAEAVTRGAAELGNAEIMSVENINWEKLDDADAIIFGCPTYMGGISAPFKKFIDESGARWLRQTWRDKIAGGFTNSGSPSGDKLNTLISLAVFGVSHAMIWVGQAELPKGEINNAGSYLGAMAQSHNASPEETPSAGDLKTAEIYGRRIAAITLKHKAK